MCLWSIGGRSESIEGFSGGNLKQKELLEYLRTSGIPTYRWNENEMECYRNRMWGRGLDQSCSGQAVVAGPFECNSETSGSTKHGEIY
jgi:hypothetical protein